MTIRKAIIPAAGLGTRFLPATKALPKEMLPIIDKPTIQYIVEEAIASGIEEIIIISGRSKRAIEDHFDKSFELEYTLQERKRYDLLEKINDIGTKAHIHYIRQREPLGLGHAVLSAKSFIGQEPFALLLGDDIVESQNPCLAQCIRQYEQYQTPIVGVQHVPIDQVQKYGIVHIVDHEIRKGKSVEVQHFVEKPHPTEAPSNYAIMGRYILDPAIFPILEKMDPTLHGEIQLTDALQILNQKKRMRAYAFEGIRYDTGDPIGFIKANLELAWKQKPLRDALRPLLDTLLSREDSVNNV